MARVLAHIFITLIRSLFILNQNAVLARRLKREFLTYA
ncbi:hypothetical protein COO91_02536 [Nostoc flagelliforme CCNUN1]|uniref:Uncharacterized protein n=1 Tax=Nostoc flagelliforme CCNUN1 TaxID=2038116 RepID=A0A2K8SP52_9NOSO|nr:hypothetical protein COO91_02536 [Nostoc flagelliforme CCNUN1]